MIYQNDCYLINYNENDKAYITDIIDAINENLKRIMDFFELQDFKYKKVINIWNDIGAYKHYIEQYVDEYQDWMVADTFDKNINILSLDLYLDSFHNDRTLTDYCKIIIHELVHSCQQEVNPISNNVEWFWEALATNLANQDLKMVNIICSKEELMNNFVKLRDAYSVSYKIGQYMLKHFTKEQILQYVKNPNLLIDDMDAILKNIK